MFFLSLSLSLSSFFLAICFINVHYVSFHLFPCFMFFSMFVCFIFFIFVHFLYIFLALTLSLSLSLSIYPSTHPSFHLPVSPPAVICLLCPISSPVFVCSWIRICHDASLFSMAVPWFRSWRCSPRLVFFFLPPGSIKKAPAATTATPMPPAMARLLASLLLGVATSNCQGPWFKRRKRLLHGWESSINGGTKAPAVLYGFVVRPLRSD